MSLNLARPSCFISEVAHEIFKWAIVALYIYLFIYNRLCLYNFLVQFTIYNNIIHTGFLLFSIKRFRFLCVDPLPILAPGLTLTAEVQHVKLAKVSKLSLSNEHRYAKRDSQS